MKVNIQYQTRRSPWGGANQFLSFFKKKLIKDGIYHENALDSDYVIFNSHHDLNKVFSIKESNPNCKIIHRIDGPIYKIRNCSTNEDVNLLKFASEFSDIVIFQSEWSKNSIVDLCEKNNISLPEKTFTIINSCDYDLFYNKPPKVKNKFLISTWSDNRRKGFDTYSQIDSFLGDSIFSNIQIDFIGRSPIAFKNIKMHQPVGSKELSNRMQNYDGYITASQNDPCSNSLCEAVQSGLKILALNDGGHPEVCSRYECAHILFDKISKEDLAGFALLANKPHNEYDSYSDYKSIFI